MIKRSICYFKTRGERRATKGDKRGRPSTTRQCLLHYWDIAGQQFNEQAVA